MESLIAAQLVELNRRFYTTYGESFAQTRRRIQDGVRLTLNQLPDKGNWLDVGCGSGSLAVEWLRAGRVSHYLGVDFSPTLLQEAGQAVRSEFPSESGARVSFAQADLSAPGWIAAAQPFLPLAGILAFAVLHHIPDHAARRFLLTQIAALLPVGGLFIHSEWQFQHSPKLMARRLPWETVGLTADQLDSGDTLLDWRSPAPGQPEQPALRYVHLFSEEELNALAAETGFCVQNTYASDGQGGQLGLYQVWQKAG